MHVAARARLVLARRPWIHWVIVAALAAGAAGAVHATTAQIAAARDRWGTTRAVLVAQQPVDPGDMIVAELVDLPVAAIPEGALDAHVPGGIARQRIASGAVLTEFDVSGASGPAALAESGTVVVALSDPLARDVAVGMAVRVTADGLVLADDATVTAVVDEVVFVAVDDRSAPSVAAAARESRASLLYLP